ncbi:hypothetical protein [Conchiformibius kuhniae]|uniref:Uncharacterized protein n=1 Tax=Conchiformibius kuhniae TaxID=211502 RepID=A0A8T9MVJ5_9NEIS|nr:hypothetical protein [Conchiformibius kuhniae]UOP05144.1 hypothetical protein LVJ77_02445 [Conchiformibius kuhniae]
MNGWHIRSALPDSEPNPSNLHDYLNPQLIGGASADARFVFDAVYAPERGHFVLTLMQIDDEWGFVAHESRLYPRSRAELAAHIRRFCADPAAQWAMADG